MGYKHRRRKKRETAQESIPAYEPSLTQGIPTFLYQKLEEHYVGQVAARIREGLEQAHARPVTLRANPLREERERVADDISQVDGMRLASVDWYEDAFVAEGVDERDLWGRDTYRAGGIYLQSLSSMLPPLLLDAQPRQDILDMCAAPGGKTSQISALTQGEGRICACELNAPRADKLEHNLAKLGVRNTQIMRVDARTLDEFFSFDRILLDAPCTGTGTIRTEDMRSAERITPYLLAKTTKSQVALIDRALTVLKPDGTLVYSTCSILPEENERIVQAALARHRDCQVVPIVLGDAPQPKTKEEKPERMAILPRADAGDFAVPTLQNELPGTLTVCPTRLFEGFYVAVIAKNAR